MRAGSPRLSITWPTSCRATRTVRTGRYLSAHFWRRERAHGPQTVDLFASRDNRKSGRYYSATAPLVPHPPPAPRVHPPNG